MSLTLIGILGILFLALVGFLISALKRSGETHVKLDGIRVPPSGSMSSGIVRALEEVTKTASHAHMQHGVFNRVLEWLQGLSVPKIDPHKTYIGIIVGVISFIGICIFLLSGIPAKVIGLLMGQETPTVVIASGAMPMGAGFQVEPNTTFYLDNIAPIFDLQLGEQQERYDCQRGELLKFRVETQGTLLIDNFTKVNIIVETPPSFPGVVTVTCPKAGRIGFSQSIYVAAPILAAPTTAATQTIPVSEIPSQIPPQTTESTAVPALILPSPSPVPTEQKVFIVMKFTMSPDGSIALLDGRFDEGSLDGYQKVGDTQSCTLSNMPNFSIPAGYSEGLIYFEGVDKYQRPSGATVVGSTISFSLCTPTGTNFSLYMK